MCHTSHLTHLAKHKHFYNILAINSFIHYQWFSHGRTASWAIMLSRSTTHNTRWHSLTYYNNSLNNCCIFWQLLLGDLVSVYVFDSNLHLFSEHHLANRMCLLPDLITKDTFSCHLSYQFPSDQFLQNHVLFNGLEWGGWTFRALDC